MITGVAKRMAGQFFAAIDKELSEPNVGGRGAAVAAARTVPRNRPRRPRRSVTPRHRPPRPAGSRPTPSRCWSARPAAGCSPCSASGSATSSAAAARDLGRPHPSWSGVRSTRWIVLNRSSGPADAAPGRTTWNPPGTPTWRGGQMRRTRSEADRQVADLLQTAKKSLGMSVAFLSRMDGTTQHLEVVESSIPLVFHDGTTMPQDDDLLLARPRRPAARGDAGHAAVQAGDEPADRQDPADPQLRHHAGRAERRQPSTAPSAPSASPPTPS